MPTAIYDSSYLTFRRRAGVLNAYNAGLNTFRDAAPGNYNLVRTEQPTLQTAEIISTRKQGGCFCATAAAGLSIHSRATPGPCSCSR
jgi:hypothetical protein